MQKTPSRKLMALCHPNLTNWGHGLCANCYYRKRYTENKNGYREKKNARNRIWSAAHKDRWRGYKLKNRHGISVEQYEEILALQGGVCAACKKPPVKGARLLSVDHDHKCCPSKDKSCGKCIRGLLHSECNWILGASGENAELLRSIAEYADKVQ